jgi:hypothetical protein
VTNEYQRNLIDIMNEFIHLTQFFLCCFLDGSNVANVIENHVTPIFVRSKLCAKILGIAFCYFDFANNDSKVLAIFFRVNNLEFWVLLESCSDLNLRLILTIRVNEEVEKPVEQLNFLNSWYISSKSL